MTITVFTIFDWSIAVIMASFAIILYHLSPKSQSAKIFAGLALIVALWDFSIGTIDMFTASRLDPSLIESVIKISYFLGTIIASLFVIFSYSYPHETKISKKLIFVIVGIEIILFYLLYFTDIIIAQPIIFENQNYPGWGYGKLWFLFDLQFFIYWVIGTKSVLSNIRSTNDPILRKNLKLVLSAFIIGVIPPAITSIILPEFGIFHFDWIGVISGLIWILIIAYAITRHHLFNIKVIAVQLITFALWIFILVRTILADSTKDLVIQGSLLVISVIFGIMLIRGVLHEIGQRERIEKLMGQVKKAYAQVKDLNEHLEEKVAEQTKEIQASYEVEKQARLELEHLNRLKDQFITSTQHHLRTPLTSLKWELEAIRKGDHGPVSQELKRALDTSDASVGQLGNIIENFIQITEKKT